MEQGYDGAAGYRTEDEEILTVGLTIVEDADAVLAILSGDEEVQVNPGM